LLLFAISYSSPYQATGLNPYDIRIPCDVPPLCYDMSYVSRWLNSESTKKALHVDEKRSHAWESCNFGINMQFHTDWMKDFSPFVADLLENGVPGLIYAGDVDFVCNYLGNQAWTYGLEWTGKAGFQAAPVQDWNAGKGLSRSSGGLTFLQVFDAGTSLRKCSLAEGRGDPVGACFRGSASVFVSFLLTPERLFARRSHGPEGPAAGGAGHAQAVRQPRTLLSGGRLVSSQGGTLIKSH
jgi:hypothetical protein